MTDAEKLEWIAKASLEDLLRKWRFGPNEGFFTGEVGDAYSKRMFGMRDADNDAWVRASKAVGWEKS